MLLCAAGQDGEGRGRIGGRPVQDLQELLLGGAAIARGPARGGRDSSLSPFSDPRRPLSGWLSLVKC